MTGHFRTAVILALSAILQAAQAPVLSVTATTDNVAGAPDAIRIEVLRWSTDDERASLMSAWNMTTGGKGRAGRAGRAARAESPAPTPTTTPPGALATALKQASTVGYLWSSEVAGYALRYAGKVAGPNGADRIILITDRRLGRTNDLWKPVGSDPPSSYDFSVIELRVDSKGDGEGRISLTGKVTPDSTAGIVTLENYAALPVVLKNVKQRIMGEH
jgi:hypothetical protein